MRGLKMKEIYFSGGNAYIILRRIPIYIFENKEGILNIDKINVFKDWLMGDYVLRDQSHFLFCETIEDADYEEIT
tara:strand:- start:26 stop:250 length:225 start_codon:yes stop_codon:yes gene_type:complete